MRIEALRGKEGNVAVVEGFHIDSVADALDAMVAARCEYGCDAMILKAEDLAPEFFALSSGLAGEILQKYTNYQMRVAIIGDFSGVESRSLHDFIYECNKGGGVFFAATREEALERLG